MQVDVLLFAEAARLAETPSVRVEVSDACTVAEIAAAVVVAKPALASLAARSRWALGNEFVEPASLFTVGQEIALIPPVSGG